MSIQAPDDDIDFTELLDIEYVDTTKTPAQRYFEELTSGKHPKLYNAQYWLKHQLYVHTYLLRKNWIVSKPNKDGGRTQVGMQEITRAFLRYYFDMVALAKFETDRPERAAMVVNREEFLDLVMGEPTIKKLMEDPAMLI